MGGDLTFDSAGAGLGTVFTLSIPVTACQFVALPQLGLPGHQRLCVVLIEEQEPLRRVLVAYLHQVLGRNGDVLHFTNVAQAAQASTQQSVGSKRSAQELTDDATIRRVLLIDQRHATEAWQALCRPMQGRVVYGYTRDPGLSDCLFVKKPIRISALRAALVATSQQAAAAGATNQAPVIASNPTTKRALSKSAERARSALKILVAEDNPSNQVILQKYLESLGYISVKYGAKLVLLN